MIEPYTNSNSFNSSPAFCIIVEVNFDSICNLTPQDMS